MNYLLQRLPLLQEWRRNWRIAESRLLFLALLVSVTAVSSVNFFTNRTDQAMQMQASQVLGGDLVIQSPRPLSKDYLHYAESLGLRTAEIISFPSMVLVNDESQLVQVKAASADYPLYGELEIAESLDAAGKSTLFSSIEPSKAWAEVQLFASLHIQPHAVVQLGNMELQLSGIIRNSPDQGAAAFQFMPQLLLPLADLPTTGLLSPASRARFSHLFAGKPKQIKAFHQWLKPRLQPTEKISSLEDGLPSIQQAIQRGQQFLSLASLLSVVLAGVAIALTSYSFSQHETNTVAVLKTMGASRRQIIQRYASQLFLLATAAALLGVVIGYLLQFVLAFVLRDMIGQVLPSPSFLPVLSGLMTAWVLVLGFSLPQLLRLVSIPPIAIFQRIEFHLSRHLILTITALIAGVLALFYLQTQRILLSAVLLLGLVVIIAFFWLISLLLLRVLRAVNQQLQQSALRLPKANFRIALLIVVFGIGFFSLLLLTSLRGDLIDRWQNTLPNDAPNYFLINIQPTEISSLKKFFKQHNYQPKTSPYPMVRGRLTEINGKAIVLDDYKSNRAKRMLDREANISLSKDLHESNTLIEGQWFDANTAEGLSIEEGFAKTLQLKIGDELTFDIAGQPFKQPITSLRKIRWDSMQPNFFILAAPAALSDRPHTFMTSLYVNTEDQQFIPELVKHYPSVSAIDVSAILGRIKSLIDKASFAVQTIFIFTLLSGIAVLFSALQSQKAERRKEIAILKSVGASHASLRKSIITEFMLIGGLAGFIAAFFAMIASNSLAYRLFELSPDLNFSLLLVGVFGGALIVGVGGYLNMRPLLKVTPMDLFKSE